MASLPPRDSANDTNRCFFGDEALHEMLNQGARCVKCGSCLSVCPVYRETLREPGAARGKLALIESILAGEIDVSPKKLKDSIYCCLLCGACTENCPNLVAGDTILRKTREIVTAKNLDSMPYRFFLRNILPFPERMETFHRAGKVLSPLFLKAVPRESGLNLRFPLGRDQKKRFIPRLTDQPFLKTYSPEKTSSKPLLALFVGCVSNYLFTHTAQATADLFKHYSMDFHVPQKQACCGLMGFGTGDTEVARVLAQQNITAFEPTGAVPIVAFCSSCSSHLKQYAELFEEATWKAKATQFSLRVRDLSEYLAEIGLGENFALQGSGMPQRITFHDPCHLRRKQSISDQPRRLLKSVRNVQFIETGAENLCCGSGGSFSLSHYDLSRKIFRRRLSPIEQAKVDTVVTSCMGCLLQFMDGLHQEGKGIRVKHLVEVLAEALSL